MVHSVLTGAVFGVEGYPVKVEVDMSEGLPCIDMVGYLGSEVKEAANRVRVALKNVGYGIPPKRITVNLSPANQKKDGTAFDLAMAIGILSCMGIIKSSVEEVMILGELGLDGSVQKVPGVLPILLMAKERGIRICIVPKDNEKEGMCINGMVVWGVADLKEAMEVYCHMGNKEMPNVLRLQHGMSVNEPCSVMVDYADVLGQPQAKRAAEIAAAGFHNLLLYGPPGTGKSMIAAAIPGILPPMTEKEKLDTSKIYSIMGKISDGLIEERPFLNPHHTITPKALVGGGQHPMPGVISLANHGVLFMDELPEFKRQTLDLLRQPMEEGEISIIRKRGSYRYPCNFMLVAAMNPCPCGYYPDRNRCNCSDKEVARYVKGISGPLLNRIDLSVAVMRNTYQQINARVKTESSEQIRERVEKARSMQNSRNGKGIFNSKLSAREIKNICNLTSDAEEVLETYFTEKQLSVRGYHRILRVARTIADLEECIQVKNGHILEAVSYRTMLDK